MSIKSKVDALELSDIELLELLQHLIYKKTEKDNIKRWRLAHLKQMAQYIQKQGISKNWTYVEIDYHGKEIDDPGQEVSFKNKDGSIAGFEFDLNFVYTQENGQNVIAIHEPLYKKNYIDGLMFDLKLPSGEVVFFDSFFELIDYMKKH